MKIKIKSYNDNWPYIFEDIKSKIREHIGSTSVKNLASKPIIDILIGIKFQELDDYITPIKNLGFTYMKKYEKEIPNRRFFFLENDTKRIAHIHLVKINTMLYVWMNQVMIILLN